MGAGQSFIKPLSSKTPDGTPSFIPASAFSLFKFLEKTQSTPDPLPGTPPVDWALKKSNQTLSDEDLNKII